MENMKKIELTQNQYALVDDEDFDKLNQYKWCAQYSSGVESFYAVRGENQKILLMHRIIMNTPRGMQTDHINHNTLDNRKENLRICTGSQNQMNLIKHKKATSNYKGVTIVKKMYKNTIYKYWYARICVNRKVIELGYFRNEIQAVKAYNKKAKELFGEYALLNKI